MFRWRHLWRPTFRCLRCRPCWSWWQSTWVGAHSCRPCRLSQGHSSEPGPLCVHDHERCCWRDVTCGVCHVDVNGGVVCHVDVTDGVVCHVDVTGGVPCGCHWWCSLSPLPCRRVASLQAVDLVAEGRPAVPPRLLPHCHAGRFIYCFCEAGATHGPRTHGPRTQASHTLCDVKTWSSAA